MEQMVSLISLGDGSTLTLDFTTGVLDPRLTFTRASTATYINSQGYVTTMAAAPTNDPTKARFDYDPTTLAPRGLLVEGTATNLLNWSESFATSGGTNNNWADTSITRTTGQADPANGTTAIRFTASAGNATVISSAAIGTSAARTFSVWLRRVTGTGDIQYTQNNGSNWTTQAITSTWTRYSFTHTANHQVGIRIVTSGDAIEMWGAQLETGSGASSYIPTGASQATRNPDYCVLPTSSFITGNPYPSTLFVDCIPATANTGFPNLARLFDRTAGGTFAYGSEIYYYTAATMSVNRKVSASTNSDRTLATGLAYNTRHKFATAIDSTSFIGSRDGVTDSGATTAPAALASVVTHLGIGCNGDSSPANVMNGWMRQIKFWPTAFPQATLNALTTL
jgi:hypothetical protein